MSGDINFDGLENYQIEFWMHSETAQLFPRLRGGVFHSTSVTGYKGIRDSGYIIPNTGQFPCKYPQTPNYYGYSKGYISLFDFGLVSDQQCIQIHHTWGQFFFDRKPVTIVLCLNRNVLSKKLIPNTAAPKLGNKDYKGRIPYVEAWYPEPIPFSVIDRFMLVEIRVEREVSVTEFDKVEVSELEELLTYTERKLSRDT